jgi:hypothetical protein
MNERYDAGYRMGFEDGRFEYEQGHYQTWAELPEDADDYSRGYAAGYVAAAPKRTLLDWALIVTVAFLLWWITDLIWRSM